MTTTTIHDLIAAEHAACWRSGRETLEATGYDHEAARVVREQAEARAHEATTAVLEARPTDLPGMAAQLRWLAEELSEEPGMEQYAAPLEPIAAQLKAMAGGAS
jgi:hypothetical protein